MKLPRPVAIISGPLLGLLACWYLLKQGHPPAMGRMAFVAIWMAGWWITEAVNIFFTSLLPLVAFPLLGIMDMKETAPSYTNEIIFLFIGGFLIAFTLEKWNLHKRMALFLLLKIGATPSRLLLGFMTASYFLSMWIVNTATTMMLLPATMAVIGQIEDQTGKRDNKMATGFLLGLAYASSIGGTATVIGTAPNMAFMGFYNSNFPNLPAVNFTNWILFSLPVSLTFFALCFQVLRYRFLRHMKHTTISMDTCRMQYQQLGRMSYEEKSITAVFFATVLLWFFRQDIVLGSFTIPGWSGFLPVGGFIKDSTIAMIASCVLYLFPSRQRKGEGLLTWDQVQRIPFGIIFLFGGGFALANGITESGLSEWLTEHLKKPVGELDTFPVVVTLCVFMTFFTELTSNTASTYLMLPILLSISAQFKASPLIFMVPVVLSASYAFMLPVATPPNTIVFGSERISMRDMTRTGLILNIIGVVLNVLAIFTLAKWLWQI